MNNNEECSPLARNAMKKQALPRLVQILLLFGPSGDDRPRKSYDEDWSQTPADVDLYRLVREAAVRHSGLR